MFIWRHPLLSLLLIIVAWIASTIDTITGGGGLITVPALMATGLPPAMELGTNKLQACFGSGMATRQFMRYGNRTIMRCKIRSTFGHSSGCRVYSSAVYVMVVAMMILMWVWFYSKTMAISHH